MIEINNLSKIYNQRPVLNQVSLTINKGDQISIQGASGSGKSTLLYLVGGLEKSDGGNVSIGDFNLDQASEDDLAIFRNNNIGFIFQFHFLLPNINVEDNMLLPGRIGGYDLKEIKNRIQNLGDYLGITDLFKKYPYQLSGGEQQRVNIVRAFSLNPPIVLCDEPTGNLDSENTERVVSLLKKLAQENETTLIVVTHDNEVAKNFSLNFVMKDGALFQ